MNLYEKLNRLDDSKSLRESDEREYCIVAKTFDGKTKFYKDGAFVDDYKSCTTFNDLDDARSEWFDVDKSKYKRVFVPVYDPEAFAKVVTECNESVDDMDRRCEKCNTLLNDGGTCPKCDDGEEDYRDMDENVTPVKEELSNREKLKRAYPELNLSEEVHNISGLSDEVEKLIYDAVKEAYDVGKADFDLWRYIVEDLEAAGYEYDTELAKRYFDELINAGASEFEYDDDIDYDEF